MKKFKIKKSLKRIKNFLREHEEGITLGLAFLPGVAGIGIGFGFITYVGWAQSKATTTIIKVFSPNNNTLQTVKISQGEVLTTTQTIPNNASASFEPSTIVPISLSNSDLAIGGQPISTLQSSRLDTLQAYYYDKFGVMLNYGSGSNEAEIFTNALKNTQTLASSMPVEKTVGGKNMFGFDPWSFGGYLGWTPSKTVTQYPKNSFEYSRDASQRAIDAWGFDAWYNANFESYQPSALDNFLSSIGLGSAYATEPVLDSKSYEIYENLQSTTYGRLVGDLSQNAGDAVQTTASISMGIVPAMIAFGAITAIPMANYLITKRNYNKIKKINEKNQEFDKI